MEGRTRAMLARRPWVDGTGDRRTVPLLRRISAQGGYALPSHSRPARRCAIRSSRASAGRPHPTHMSHFEHGEVRCSCPRRSCCQTWFRRSARRRPSASRPPSRRSRRHGCSCSCIGRRGAVLALIVLGRVLVQSR
jgi:hypothetical protein